MEAAADRISSRRSSGAFRERDDGVLDSMPSMLLND
jgi:hypothetical protein